MGTADGCFLSRPIKPCYMNFAKSPHAEFSINAFQQGQPRAFSYVFDHYYHALRFFANRLIQDQPAAEDIAQETLIKLWEKHSGFHSPQAIKAFLYITTRNACFNFLKRAQSGAKNHKLWLNTWDESDDFILNHLTKAEVIREIYIILEMLPPECRKVMRYYFIEGKENHEIAQLLNISIHTVKNQKARAIYLIRKKLGQRALMILVLFLLKMHGKPAHATAIPTLFHLHSQNMLPILAQAATYTISLLNFFWLL
jgi:RNA polymerase sigma-70 factor (family 1)